MGRNRGIYCDISSRSKIWLTHLAGGYLLVRNLFFALYASRSWQFLARCLNTASISESQSPAKTRGIEKEGSHCNRSTAEYRRHGRRSTRSARETFHHYSARAPVYDGSLARTHHPCRPPIVLFLLFFPFLECNVRRVELPTSRMRESIMCIFRSDGWSVCWQENCLWRVYFSYGTITCPLPMYSMHILQCALQSWNMYFNSQICLHWLILVAKSDANVTIWRSVNVFAKSALPTLGYSRWWDNIYNNTSMRKMNSHLIAYNCSL